VHSDYLTVSACCNAHQPFKFPPARVSPGS
jgi:hypothetical protein